MTDTTINPPKNYFSGMKIFRSLYSTYAAILFAILFFFFFLPLLVPMFFSSMHHLIGKINRIWARTFFAFLGIPVHISYHPKIKKNKQYIFCSNHFSYLDIPLLGLTKHNAVFVGKNDMEKIPLFGMMYSKLHITVDRAKLKSRYATIQKSLKAIDEGKNLIIFPEGGIITKNPPQMVGFKDGAFRVAIEKQIPVVPITIVNNWIVLPESLLLRWKPIYMFYHEPIETKGMTLEQLNVLKMQTFRSIDQELMKYK